MAQHRAPRAERYAPRHRPHGYIQCLEEERWGITFRQRVRRTMYVTLAIGVLLVLAGVASYAAHP